MSDSSVSAAMFEAIVEGYQSVEPLKIGELWALPSLLRFVLIENLRRLALRVNRTRELRNIANTLADRIVAGGRRRRPAPRSWPRYAAHARDTTFATQLLYRLRDGSRNAGRALIWLETELESHGTNAEAMIIAEHQTLSSGNVTTGNIVRGLRLINDVDWTDVVREDQPGRRAAARADRLRRRSISPRATSTAPRSRTWPAAPGPHRVLRRRPSLAAGESGCARGGGRLPTRRTSASSWSAERRASSKRRSATGRPSARRFMRAYRKDRLGRHRRPVPLLIARYLLR